MKTKITYNIVAFKSLFEVFFGCLVLLPLSEQPNVIKRKNGTCISPAVNTLVMFDNLLQLDINLLPLNPRTLCRTLLYGDPSFSFAQNHNILTITIKFLCDSRRFAGPLF